MHQSLSENRKSELDSLHEELILLTKLLDDVEIVDGCLARLVILLRRRSSTITLRGVLLRCCLTCLPSCGGLGFGEFSLGLHHLFASFLSLLVVGWRI